MGAAQRGQTWKKTASALLDTVTFPMGLTLQDPPGHSDTHRSLGCSGHARWDEKPRTHTFAHCDIHSDFII